MEKSTKIAILRDVINIKSVNGNEKKVAEYLANLLKAHHIPSNIITYSENRSNLIAIISQGDSKETLGLSGHMDVVDPGDESQWKYPPFKATIENGKLYGRGATDMKSGLLAMVIAMIELKEKKIPFNGNIKLLATVGEEVGELGAEQLTKLGHADDLTSLIIGEPTNYNLMYAHMGSINYSVISHGKEAHSSMPELGYNAINHLNDFISEVNMKMKKISAQYVNDILGRTIHNVTVISGGNQVNSIPNLAKVQGNIRSIPEFDNEKIIHELQGIVDKLNQEGEYKLELAIDYNKIPVKADSTSKLIKVIQNQFEQPLPLISSAGTTDAAEFTKSKTKFDFVVFGPGVSEKAHQIDEYVELDNYLDMIDKYQAIAMTYLK